MGPSVGREEPAVPDGSACVAYAGIISHDAACRAYGIGMILLIPVLVALVGLLMYALAANPKLIEIGRIMFAFGLLVALLRVGTEMINLLR